MPLNIYNPVDEDGIFDVQAKALRVLDALNTARLTTIPDEIQQFLNQAKKIVNRPFDLTAAFESVASGAIGWQDQQASLAEQVRQTLTAHLLAAVEEDGEFLTLDLETALQYLIDEMIAQGLYVQANSLGLGLATDADNVGDVAIVFAARRGDGRNNEDILAEQIAVEVTDEGGGGTPSVEFSGVAATGDKLDQDWPRGSGASVQVSAASEVDNLIDNGDFEDVTIANVPDGAIIYAGVPGTTVRVNPVPEQTVAIAGTPTAGSYHLLWTTDGKSYATPPLAYDAAASTVQAALRLLPGLAAVEVASTGTSPDLTHTVTFTGVGGAPAALAYVSHLNTGTITVTITVAGEHGAYRGRSLGLYGNGATQHDVYWPLPDDLDPETVYFAHCRILRVEAAASGVLRLAVVDGINGAVTQDDDGNNNSATVNVSAIGTGEHESFWLSFRVTREQSRPSYLSIKATTAIPAGCAVYIDELTVVPGEAIYSGGVYVMAFAGKAARIRDRWTLTATNDRAGFWQTWYDRVFLMTEKDLLLPIAGSLEIPAALITEEESSSSSSSSSVSENSSSTSSSSASSSCSPTSSSSSLSSSSSSSSSSSASSDSSDSSSNSSSSCSPTSSSSCSPTSSSSSSSSSCSPTSSSSSSSPSSESVEESSNSSSSSSSSSSSTSSEIEAFDFALIFHRDYLELDDYGGEAFTAATSSEDRAYWFDDDSGAPMFDDPYSTQNTPIRTATSAPLDNACGLYALIESCKVALESQGFDVTYTPVGGVLQEKWTIAFASDITASDLWGKSIFLYAPAFPPAPGVYPQPQEVQLTWYESSPGLSETNSAYWGVSPPSTLRYGWLTEVQPVSDDSPFDIAIKTATAIEAVRAYGPLTVFTASVSGDSSASSGAWSGVLDFTSFNPSGLDATQYNWMRFWADTNPQRINPITTIRGLYASVDGFSMSPFGVGGTAVECAFTTGMSADDYADVVVAAINTNFSSIILATKTGTGIVTVTPVSPYLSLWTEAAFWGTAYSHGLDVANERGGSPHDLTIEIEVECIEASPTIPWMKHSTTGPGSKVTLTQVTAGTYHPNDHILGVNITGTPLGPPGHITTDNSDLTIIDNT